MPCHVLSRLPHATHRYSMSLHSAYMDVLKWKVVNLGPVPATSTFIANCAAAAAAAAASLSTCAPFPTFPHQHQPCVHTEPRSVVAQWCERGLSTGRRSTQAYDWCTSSREAVQHFPVPVSVPFSWSQEHAKPLFARNTDTARTLLRCRHCPTAARARAQASTVSGEIRPSASLRTTSTQQRTMASRSCTWRTQRTISSTSS